MNCRSCGTPTEPVLDLGRHYLPDFTTPGLLPPREPWPLEVEFCPGCTLLQLNTTTPRDLLYHDRYGFKSGVNEAIRADLASVAKYAAEAYRAGTIHGGEPAFWLDIASNDGTLLSNVPSYVFRVGVDPLGQFAAEAAGHADRIIVDYFGPGHFQQFKGTGRFDVITSVSMFYDLDDPGGFAAGVSHVLAPDGVWVIQQNYAADMITRNAVDNICHEHITYFTVNALFDLLGRYGLQINDVTYSPVNGGCIRTLVSWAGTRHVEPSVAEALAKEHEMGLHRAGTWRQWAVNVCGELDKTRQFLDQAHDEGQRVLVYGASTRGGTILQMIGAGPDLLPAAVERNPAKVGKVMAATGIPIISEEAMRADPPDALLVSPWFFRDVFVAREAAYLEAGGRMVFPLPHFEVVDRYGVRF